MDSVIVPDIRKLKFGLLKIDRRSFVVDHSLQLLSSSLNTLTNEDGVWDKLYDSPDSAKPGMIGKQLNLG